jgi:hypothetical protein
MRYTNQITKIAVGLLLFQGLQSCTKYKTTVKIIKPKSEQVVIANESVEIYVEMTDTDAVSIESLFVTKENNTHDTVISIVDRTTMHEYQFSRSFIAEPNTRYKIFASGTGYETAKDSVFVTCD